MWIVTVGTVERQSAQIVDASELPSQLAEAREALRIAQAATAAAEAQRAEAEEDSAKQREANSELLERLLAQQV